MYVLDSSRQKFDVGIGVAFLSDNATRPVERYGRNSAANSDVEFPSNSFRLIEFDMGKI